MLISMAVDFRHANVATRERFHLTDARIARLEAGNLHADVREVVCLATCNRSEIYAWTASHDPATPAAFDHAITAIARAWMGNKADAKALLSIAQRQAGLDVARRVLRIATGLDSQVMGDGQILGQIRECYRRASETGAAGSVLHRLFDTALRTGKRVQTETSLTGGRRSVGAEAAATARDRFGNLAHARLVVVGCGKTGQSVARQLNKLGARDVVCINRSSKRAQQLAAEVGGRAAPWEALHVEVAMADVAIAATGATDRSTYLARPDLGRRFTEASRRDLADRAANWGVCDLAVIVSDGLSAPAAERHAAPTLQPLFARLTGAGWRVAPVLVVPFARVKLQDELGPLLRCRLSLVLLGERPGLGAPDSLGAYLTFAPGPGRTDADRNCVSNIRPEGLPPAAAAERLAGLLLAASRLGCTGTGLKEDAALAGDAVLSPPAP